MNENLRLNSGKTLTVYAPTRMKKATRKWPSDAKNFLLNLE
jgi:hypothetical protein